MGCWRTQFLYCCANAKLWQSFAYNFQKSPKTQNTFFYKFWNYKSNELSLHDYRHLLVQWFRCRAAVPPSKLGFESCWAHPYNSLWWRLEWHLAKTAPETSLYTWTCSSPDDEGAHNVERPRVMYKLHHNAEHRTSNCCCDNVIQQRDASRWSRWSHFTYGYCQHHSFTALVSCTICRSCF